MLPDDTLQAQLKAKIEKWLLDDGWQLGPNVVQGFSWSTVATDSGNRKVVISQPVNRPDQIYLEAAINISDDMRTRFAGFTDDKRDSMLNELILELARAGLEFNGMDPPLTRITLRDYAYFDGLTKDGFMERTRKLRNYVFIAIRILQRAN